MRNLLAVLALAITLGLVGCGDKSATTESNQVAVTQKKASKKDTVILRCGSTLTKTGKPCMNKVGEDQYCHLHARLEVEKEAKATK